MKNHIKEQIKQVEKEMYRAVDLGNHSYAQALYFDDLMPLQKTLNCHLNSAETIVKASTRFSQRSEKLNQKPATKEGP